MAQPLRLLCGTLSYDAFAWHPEGTHLLTADKYQSHIWNLRRGVSHAINISGKLLSLAWSPDGAFITTTSNSCHWRLWRLADCACICTRNLGFVRAAKCGSAWSPDGSLVAISDDRAIQLWDPRALAMVRVLHRHSVSSLAWSPSSRLLAVAFKCTIELWDPWTAERRAVVAPDCPGVVTMLAWGPKHRLAAVWDTSFGARVIVWDADLSQTRELKQVKQAAALSWSRNGMLACSTGVAIVRLWDEQGAIVTTLRTGASTAHAFSPDGRTLAVLTRGSKNVVQLWDTDVLWWARRAVMLAVAAVTSQNCV